MHAAVAAGSFIPPKPVRELRDLVRYRFKLTNVRTSEKNRFQKSLTACLAQLDVAVADAARPFAGNTALISTAPGIQSVSATVIIAEIGAARSIFSSSKHLCSWAGLTLE